MTLDGLGIIVPTEYISILTLAHFKRIRLHGLQNNNTRHKTGNESIAFSQDASRHNALARAPGADTMRSRRISRYVHIESEGVSQGPATNSKSAHGVVSDGLVSSYGHKW